MLRAGKQLLKRKMGTAVVLDTPVNKGSTDRSTLQGRADEEQGVPWLKRTFSHHCGIKPSKISHKLIPSHLNRVRNLRGYMGVLVNQKVLVTRIGSYL